MRVLVGGLGAMIARASLLLTTTGAHTAFFPTLFVAYFAIGLGAGTSFMPLLTIAMADVPMADAGLGSGIVNVSQQVSGGARARGARARSRPTTRRRSRPPVTASRARCSAATTSPSRSAPRASSVGIVVALVLLRPLERRVTESPAEELDELPELALERQAA